MRILIVNGPNLNMLGIREPEIYGKSTYKELCSVIEKEAVVLGIEAEIFQSNHEGEIVDKIQSAYKKADAIIINAAAYTHTSIAILDALKAVNLPAVEVHLSDIKAREPFRQKSYISMYAEKSITGQGFEGYITAMRYLKEKYIK